MKSSKIRVGDSVKVIAGDFSGNICKIKSINRIKNFVYLEEVFVEKFIKNVSKDANNNDGNKKRVFIPISISNIKKEAKALEKE